MTLPPIFVAGTGRSGTTRLTDVLGGHPDVWAVPGESRFLIDPGGLEDLVLALTERHTPYHAQRALDTFEHLLTDAQAGGKDNVFPWWNLPSIFGKARYADWLSRFVDELTWYTFDVLTEPASDKEASAGDGSSKNGLAEPGRQPMRVGRYFHDRRELTELCGRYVGELVGGAATDAGKRTWCEKTPLNVLSMGFLWELFPTARIVHITRHPLQVAASHLDMPWAPHTVVEVCHWLEPIYRRMLTTLERHGSDERLLRVRLEDLAAEWPRSRRTLFEALGLPDAQTPDDLSPDRVVHGRSLSADDEAYVRDRLGFAISALGYA